MCSTKHNFFSAIILFFYISFTSRPGVCVCAVHAFYIEFASCFVLLSWAFIFVVAADISLTFSLSAAHCAMWLFINFRKDFELFTYNVSAFGSCSAQFSVFRWIDKLSSSVANSLKNACACLNALVPIRIYMSIAKLNLRNAIFSAWINSDPILNDDENRLCDFFDKLFIHEAMDHVLWASN